VSSRGGIYSGPGGELLHGDGRQVDRAPEPTVVRCPLCKKVQRLPHSLRCVCGADLAPWEPLVVKESK